MNHELYPRETAWYINRTTSSYAMQNELESSDKMLIKQAVLDFIQNYKDLTGGKNLS